jgi:hypothetical protein
VPARKATWQLAAVARDTEALLSRHATGPLNSALRDQLAKTKALIAQVTETGIGEDDAVPIVRAGLTAIHEAASRMCT